MGAHIKLVQMDRFIKHMRDSKAYGVILFIFLRAGYSTHKRFVLGGEECAAPFAGKTFVSCSALVTY
jgi:hypothetical protein